MLSLARSARGDDASGHRAEFIRLVETAQELNEDSTFWLRDNQEPGVSDNLYYLDNVGFTAE